ncbi:MAG: exodeoxyribonuclease III [Bacteroidetes bacterium]|nr:MAG: exodeoxyribonuclease III [Bacteroidota bacterium]
MTSILTYNVNGIRAAERKSFLSWLAEESPDILCIQETKVQHHQLGKSLTHPDGYHTYWFDAEKKGYSGVAIFTKREPLNVVYGCGMDKYDREGRVLRADFEEFSILSTYFPSGTTGDARQAFKEEFMDDFYEYIRQLKTQIPNLIISGDFNICHKEIDIHDPVRNKNSSGFLPHERAWLSKFFDLGFIDAFRKFNQQPHQYTWWSYRARARANNKGWRIDYHAVAKPLENHCADACILAEVVHSDHCPVKLIMDF